MTAWRRFRALSAADRALVTEAAALLIAIRVGLVLFRYSTLRRAFSRYVPSGSSSTRVERVIWAVSTASARHHALDCCLVQAVAADVMLRRRGHDPDLRFGVRLVEKGSARLEAHVWIHLGGVVLIGQLNDIDEYLEMSPPRMA